MIDFWKRLYHSQQFHPTILGVFVNPFYFARKGLYRNINFLSKSISGRVLDIGCGQKPYEQLFSCDEYIGIESDTPQNRLGKKADIFYDGFTIPFADHYFDCIFISQVFEHVFNPDQLLDEIYRLLKPQGYLLMTVPFIWDEHEQPHDFARYSSFGIRHLLEKKGFKIIVQRKSVNDIRVIFQLIAVSIYKKTPLKNKYLDLLRTLFFIAPFNILGEVLARITPSNDDLYLDNIVLARK